MRELASAAALDLSNVSKTFGSVRVLTGVDLRIEPGQVHSLIGHNGSGKSTLVKLLSGYYRPDSGARLSVSGKQVPLGDPAAAHRAGLRFIHQSLGLIPDFDASDNIGLGTGYRRSQIGAIRWAAARQDARVLLAELGYDLDVRRPVRTLSLAQQTGVAIARAVATQDGAPISVLVLDEPTAALNKPEADHLFEVVQRLCQRGIAVLFISHRLDEVCRVSHQITVLRDGAVVHSSTASSVNSADRLIELMLGSPHAIDHPGDEAVAVAGNAALRVCALRTKTIGSIDFEVAGGEIVGFAGITGSGRDEVVPALFGATAREGTFTVAGESVSAQDPAAAVRAGVAMLPAMRRRDALFPAMSVAQNLSIAGLPKARGGRLDTRRENRECEEWMRRMTIRPSRADIAVDLLSGGNQQKVVLARWLKTAPTTLLLDEPTQGVDAASAADIHQMIRTAARDGAAVLVASADTDELARLCVRVFVMRDGKVAATLTGDRITRERIDALALRETS